MVARGAIVFVGLIVAMMFAKIYAMFLFAVVGLLIDLGSPVAFVLLYLVCLVAGAFNAFYLLKSVWPMTPTSLPVRDARRH